MYFISWFFNFIYHLAVYVAQISGERVYFVVLLLHSKNLIETSWLGIIMVYIYFSQSSVSPLCAGFLSADILALRCLLQLPLLPACSLQKLQQCHASRKFELQTLQIHRRLVSLGRYKQYEAIHFAGFAMLSILFPLKRHFDLCFPVT